VAAEPFSRVVVVDFSANSTPKLGADSIWVATGDARRISDVRNVATRRELEDRLCRLGDRPGRSLVIIDVALGWPEGLASLICPDRPHRAGVAAVLAEMIDDDARNENNRFDVAGELNRRAGVAAFWGHPHGRTYRWLSATKAPPRGLTAWTGHHLRQLERACGGTIKSPLQLYGNGSVGSQSLLAQAMIERMRLGGVPLSVWPFERAHAKIVVVEEFFNRPEFVLRAASCRDESQVRSVAAAVARDLRAGIDPLAAVNLNALSPTDRRVVRTEEGWLARLSTPTK